MRAHAPAVAGVVAALLLALPPAQACHAAVPFGHGLVLDPGGPVVVGFVFDEFRCHGEDALVVVAPLLGGEGEVFPARLTVSSPTLYPCLGHCSLDLPVTVFRLQNEAHGFDVVGVHQKGQHVFREAVLEGTYQGVPASFWVVFP